MKKFFYESELEGMTVILFALSLAVIGLLCYALYLAIISNKQLSRELFESNTKIKEFDRKYPFNQVN